MIKNLKEFLKTYNHTEVEYKKTGLDWNELLKISDDFDKIKKDLESTGKYLVDRLITIKKAHSVRFRLKDNEHLIDKIIRKKIENPERDLSLKSYRAEITDLIGLRILHLFKEDWLEINQYLISKFDQGENPTAYLRQGDTEEYIRLFEKNGCEIRYHKFGYRSVHYLIKSNLDKEVITSEVQVRTIFEEAWSEIDHTVRYPNNLNNIILEQFLVIFNRLAGSSDQMGSYVMYLKKELERFEVNYSKYEDTIAKNSKLIEELKSKIKTLELKEKDLFSINTNLDTISGSWRNISLPKFEGIKGLESVSMNFNNLIEPIKGSIELSGLVDFSKTLVKASQPLNPTTSTEPSITQLTQKERERLAPENKSKEKIKKDKRKKKKKNKK